MNLEKDYGFEGAEKTCRCVEEKKLLKNYTVEYVYVNSEYDAYLALKQGYLVPAAMYVSDALRFYKNGILNGAKGCETSPDGPDHAVIIVGLSYDPIWGMWFWLVRNSWGPSWGDNGYFRVRAFCNCGHIGSDLAYFKFHSK